MAADHLPEIQCGQPVVRTTGSKKKAGKLMEMEKTDGKKVADVCLKGKNNVLRVPLHEYIVL